MKITPSPIEVANTLSAVVDVLIPGDADFPPASAVGTQGLVSARIREHLGNDAFAQYVNGLNRMVIFAEASRQEQAAIVEAFAQEEPELFSFLRFATYFSYYEMPPVVATLQMLGHDYNDAPQPLGYSLPPFDPAVNLPSHPRGSYKKTEEIIRIDLSALADLALPVKGA